VGLRGRDIVQSRGVPVNITSTNQANSKMREI
jgi:hypothetical protein